MSLWSCKGKEPGPVRGSALARQLAPTFQERIGLSPFAQMIYNSWWGCERGVNVSGGRRNVKVYCLLAKRRQLFFCWAFAEWGRGRWSDVHQMFICARPGVVVTTLIKDLSALMFYSYFMRQPYLNYLSALILYIYKLVSACVHNCSAALSMDVHKHSMFVIQSFVF